MGKSITIKLSDMERSTLMMWVSSGKTEQRMVKRAQVILSASGGVPLKEISARSGLSWQNCLKWRKRFLEKRLDGLNDVARSGKPAAITLEKRVEVMARACKNPDDGSTKWSVRKLADACGFSKSTVHRILSQASLKPHKTEYWCGKSPEPEFSEKPASIIGLYLSPSENALVVSVEEKSEIQAQGRIPSILPLRPGRAGRRPHSSTRHGTTCLLAALLAHKGEVDRRCVDLHAHEEFLCFLKHLYRKFPHRHLHVIIDRYSPDKHWDAMEWISHKRRLTLHFTSTYSSWLNQIEIWFGILARNVIRGGVWRSKQELVNQILYYIKRHKQERAAPFRWTLTGMPCKVEIHHII